uniref:Uncharacterized protein n=1 Tax=Knipowitschia caucasica TaxID=637954 RepID=A0AAV2JFX3_KNICA
MDLETCKDGGPWGTPERSEVKEKDHGTHQRGHGSKRRTMGHTRERSEDKEGGPWSTPERSGVKEEDHGAHQRGQRSKKRTMEHKGEFKGQRRGPWSTPESSEVKEGGPWVTPESREREPRRGRSVEQRLTPALPSQIRLIPLSHISVSSASEV